MNFLNKILSLFSGGSGRSRDTMTIYVLSHRCNEPISAELDLRNALSRSDDSDAAYYTRKVIQGSGANRCFTTVEVQLWFDRNKQLIRHEVSGGEWLTDEEYPAEVERFNAPPEEDDEEASYDKEQEEMNNDSPERSV